MELQGELQRITGTNLDEQGAANSWAGTSNLSTLAALNAKAGLTGSATLGFNGVCNRIAGTSNLEAGAALATIASGSGGGHAGSDYLLESGDIMLLEDGSSSYVLEQ